MALFLKYRPRDFDSIVGQTFTKETLKRAVQSEKTVGAYLFCGPRGTGKTSTARIMAKAINCGNLKDGNPCNNCEICNSINNESLVDVVEIDAASHTGVDNIREIIEKARFRPSHAKYKIYIIDEVHMLSKGAFNALLKILEEPPEYVKFILATTETHKVPETIISRCQRYDMNRITLEDIKTRLKYIANSENITIDNKSLDYIAKSANGGLRNAISLFEQLVSNSEINYYNIISFLGIIEKDKLDNFLEKLINKDKSLLDDYNKLIETGKNIKVFFKELIFYTKDKSIEKIKKGENISNFVNILEVLDETYTNTKNSLDENTTFLIGLLKLLSGYSHHVQTQIPTKIESPHSNSLPKGENMEGLENNENPYEISPIELEMKGEQQENLSQDDIIDIFGGEEKNTIPENKSSSIASITKIERSYSEGQTQDNNVFNKENFISELKKLGAKGGLTMGIRGAEISLNGDKLLIQLKTAFGLKSINTTDNIELLNLALGTVGLNDIKIEFK